MSTEHRSFLVDETASRIFAQRITDPLYHHQGIDRVAYDAISAAVALERAMQQRFPESDPANHKEE